MQQRAMLEVEAAEAAAAEAAAVETPVPIVKVSAAPPWLLYGFSLAPAMASLWLLFGSPRGSYLRSTLRSTLCG